MCICLQLCSFIVLQKCHKTNPNPVGSHIDSPDWIKNKKATINLPSIKKITNML